MWSFFRRWFPFFFKEKAPETGDRGLVIDNSEIVKPDRDQPVPDGEHEAVRMDVTGKAVLRLKRLRKESDHTRGELSWKGEVIARTLEGPISGPSLPDKRAIPAGDYLLELREEGGFHTSYKFRFRDFHQGMLRIKNVRHLDFVYLLMGNEASLSYANILLGKDFEEESLVRTEEAYRRVYGELFPLLEMGEEVVLRIE